MIAACGFFGWHWSVVAEKTLAFSVEIMDLFKTVCEEGGIGIELDHQYMKLVHEWMCTTDCKCYAGANGEIKEKWIGYGDEVLQKFLRNDLDTMELGPNNT